MFPFYFLGVHISVVNDLFNFAENLQLTEAVCKEFPDVIGQFLTQYFRHVTADGTPAADDDDDYFQVR